MTQNVQEILLLLFSIIILSNCDEWMCPRNLQQGAWRSVTDTCYKEITPTLLKRWVSNSLNIDPESAFFEHCDSDQGVPVPVFLDPLNLKQDIMLIAAIFSNTVNNSFKKAHLYGNGHRYFELSMGNVKDFRQTPGMKQDQIGCLVRKSPGNQMKNTDAWACGENGTVWDGYFPPELKGIRIHSGCGYTTGYRMFATNNRIQKFNDEKVFTETLLTHEFSIFCTFENFLSDVYIIGKIDLGYEHCLGNIKRIGGRLFIINVEMILEIVFQNLEEIGENVQYGKRPIIQVVGNKIPAISFPNLKKIHCEFSTDVCVVYANNNISKFAGANYTSFPTSEEEIYVQTSKLMPQETISVIYVIKGRGEMKNIIIGFVLCVLFTLTICSFWMFPKENDYPDNFKYKFF